MGSDPVKSGGPEIFKFFSPKENFSVFCIVL